jgi:SNF2 family DNA or RNA helicase
MTTTQLRCEKRILLDATVIENNVGELSCLRAFFPGFTQKDLQKSIFYRKVEMPRNIVRKTVHIVLPDEVKRSMMYGEWLLLEALRGKKKFQIYKYLMENIRKLSSVVDKRDIGWYKVQALESIVTRSDADRGILFATSVASAEACVAELQRIGKRVKAITGKTKMKERHEIRDEFNSYKLDYIVGTRAVERGLDLPSGKAVLHFDTPFSGSAYTQRDRVTRMASYDEKTTTIFTFQIDDSIEELQREIVNAKIATDKNLQNGVVKAVLTTRWTDFMENLIARRRKLCKSKRKK